MKNKLFVILSLMMSIVLSVPTYANAQEQDVQKITLDKKTVEQLSLSSDSTIYSNQTTQENDEKFSELLDNLLDLKIEKFNIEKQKLGERDEARLEEIEDAMETTRENIKAQGGQILSDDQVQLLVKGMQNNSMETRGKPNVPADTKKYEYTSRATNAYYNGKIYPVFHINVQPKTLGGNMLVNEVKQEEVDSDTYSSKTNSKVATVYIQKAIGNIFEHASKYASWLPYEFLFPSDGEYSKNATYRVLMNGVSYTEMDFIYVAAPNKDAYDLVISTGKATGSIDVIFRHIGNPDEVDTFKWSSQGKYYNDSVQAATFYGKGENTNHYYVLKSITAKIDSRTVFTMAIKTVSSPISL